MYSEKTFKNYIFWIQVKRVVLIILLSIIGAGIGIAIGAFLKGTFQIDSYNNAIIIFSTLFFFLLSLLITAGTGKEVQDGYWKIAVLRKLTVIQKLLESETELVKKDDNMKIEAMKKFRNEILTEENSELLPARLKKDVKSEKSLLKKKIIKSPTGEK